MNIIRYYGLLALGLLWAAPALAQTNVLPNYQTSTGPVQVSPTNPLPVTNSGSGGSVTQGTIPWVSSIGYWGATATALGAPSTYGTSPGAVTVPGVNAFVTNTVGIQGVAGGVAQATVGIGTANIATGQVSVATGSTLIVAARTGVQGTGRKTVTLINNSTTAVYLGNSGVTTSTGVLLPGTAGASISIDTQAAIYGAASTGTEVVSYVESY